METKKTVHLGYVRIRIQFRIHYSHIMSLFHTFLMLPLRLSYLTFSANSFVKIFVILYD